jgi:hypothetical protein
MVMPGYKTFIFFGVMALVAILMKYTGTDIPPELAELLTEEQIKEIAGKGESVVNWILIVGGIIFRMMTKTPPLSK